MKTEDGEAQPEASATAGSDTEDLEDSSPKTMIWWAFLQLLQERYIERAPPCNLPPLSPVSAAPSRAKKSGHKPGAHHTYLVVESGMRKRCLRFAVLVLRHAIFPECHPWVSVMLLRITQLVRAVGGHSCLVCVHFASPVMLSIGARWWTDCSGLFSAGWPASVRL